MNGMRTYGRMTIGYEIAKKQEENQNKEEPKIGREEILELKNAMFNSEIYKSLKERINDNFKTVPNIKSLRMYFKDIKQDICNYYGKETRYLSYGSNVSMARQVLRDNMNEYSWNKFGKLSKLSNYCIDKQKELDKLVSSFSYNIDTAKLLRAEIRKSYLKTIAYYINIAFDEFCMDIFKSTIKEN